MHLIPTTGAYGATPDSRPSCSYETGPREREEAGTNVNWEGERVERKGKLEKRGRCANGNGLFDYVRRPTNYSFQSLAVISIFHHAHATHTKG